MAELDEEYLLVLLKGGSYRAFTELYNQWAKELYQFVFSFVKSRLLTEDIVQETFVRVWSNHTNIVPQKSFKAYLFTISYHMVIKEFRRQLNNPLIEDYMEYANNLSISEDYGMLRLDFDRFISDLKDAKATLTNRQRTVFEMNKQRNMSIKQISENLNLNEQTVRNHLAIAVRQLKKKLQQYVLFCTIYL